MLIAVRVLIPLALVGPAGCVATETATAPAHADYTETIRGSTIEFDLAWIREGDFWIGRHEVTWDEFLLYCDFEESAAIPPGVDAVTKPSKPLDVEPYDRDWGAGRRPAVGMSWNAAQKYCRWLSLNTGRTYRLPTEAEWTLACGPQDGSALDDVAWYAGNSGGMTHPVAEKAPDRRGLHDMLGNLWEYCGTPYDDADPKRAVLRGGSWKDGADRVNPGERLRFDNDWVLRDPAMPAGVWWVPDGDHLGFRVVRSAKRASKGVATR